MFEIQKTTPAQVIQNKNNRSYSDGQKKNLFQRKLEYSNQNLLQQQQLMKTPENQFDQNLRRDTSPAYIIKEQPQIIKVEQATILQKHQNSYNHIQFYNTSKELANIQARVDETNLKQNTFVRKLMGEDINLDEDFERLDRIMPTNDKNQHDGNFSLIYTRIVIQKLLEELKRIENSMELSGTIIYANSFLMKIEILMRFLNIQLENRPHTPFKSLIITENESSIAIIQEHINKKHIQQLSVYVPDQRNKISMEHWGETYESHDIFILPMRLVVSLLISGYLKFTQFDYIILENVHNPKEQQHLTQIMRYYGYYGHELRNSYQKQKKFAKIIGFTGLTKSLNSNSYIAASIRGDLQEICNQYNSVYISLSDEQINEIELSILVKIKTYPPIQKKIEAKQEESYQVQKLADIIINVFFPACQSILQKLGIMISDVMIYRNLTALIIELEEKKERIEIKNVMREVKLALIQEIDRLNGEGEELRIQIQEIKDQALYTFLFRTLKNVFEIFYELGERSVLYYLTYKVMDENKDFVSILWEKVGTYQSQSQNKCFDTIRMICDSFLKNKDQDKKVIFFLSSKVICEVVINQMADIFDINLPYTSGTNDRLFLRNLEFQTLDDPIINYVSYLISFYESYPITEIISFQENSSVNIIYFTHHDHLQEINTSINQKKQEVAHIRLSTCIDAKDKIKAKNYWSKLENFDPSLKFQTNADALCFLFSAQQVFNNFYLHIQELVKQQKLYIEDFVPPDFQLDEQIEMQINNDKQQLRGIGKVEEVSEEIQKSPPQFQTKLYLPEELVKFFYQQYGIINEQRSFTSKKEAKQYQYLVLVKQLHQKKLLNDNLYPDLQYYIMKSRQKYEQQQISRDALINHQQMSQFSGDSNLLSQSNSNTMSQDQGEEIKIIYLAVFVGGDKYPVNLKKQRDPCDVQLKKTTNLEQQNPEKLSRYNSQIIRKYEEGKYIAMNFPYQDTQHFVGILLNLAYSSMNFLLPYNVRKEDIEEITNIFRNQVKLGILQENDYPKYTLPKQKQISKLQFSEILEYEKLTKSVDIIQQLKFNYLYSLYTINNAEKRFLKELLQNKFSFSDDVFLKMFKALRKLYKKINNSKYMVRGQQNSAWNVIRHVFKIDKPPNKDIKEDARLHSHPYLVSVQKKENKFLPDINLINRQKRQVESHVFSMLFSSEHSEKTIDKYHLITSDGYYQMKNMDIQHMDRFLQQQTQDIQLEFKTYKDVDINQMSSFKNSQSVLVSQNIQQCIIGMNNIDIFKKKKRQLTDKIKFFDYDSSFYRNENIYQSSFLPHLLIMEDSKMEAQLISSFREIDYSKIGFEQNSERKQTRNLNVDYAKLSQIRIIEGIHKSLLTCTSQPSSQIKNSQSKILIDLNSHTKQLEVMRKNESSQYWNGFNDLFELNTGKDKYLGCTKLQTFIDGNLDEINTNKQPNNIIIKQKQADVSPFLYEQYKVQQISLLRFIQFKEVQMLKNGIEIIIKENIPLTMNIQKNEFDLRSPEQHIIYQQYLDKHNGVEEKLQGFYLTHSYLIQEALITPTAKKTIDYERLEFFGDACISFLVVLELFSKADTFNEGELDFYRIKSISNTNFIDINRRFKFYKHMIYDKSQLNIKQNAPPSFSDQNFQKLLKTPEINQIDAFKFQLKESQIKLETQTENQVYKLYRKRDNRREELGLYESQQELKFLSSLIEKMLHSSKAQQLQSLFRKFPRVHQIIKQETYNYKKKSQKNENSESKITESLTRYYSKDVIDKICYRLRYELQDKGTSYNLIKEAFIKKQLKIVRKERILVKVIQLSQKKTVLDFEERKKQFTDCVEGIAGCLTLNTSLHSTYEFLLSVDLFKTQQVELNINLEKQIAKMNYPKKFVEECRANYKMDQLERSLGYEFINKSILASAIAHKSFKEYYSKNFQQKEDIYDQERLNYLGNFLINYLVSDRVFNQTKLEPKHNDPKRMHLKKQSLNNNLLLSVIAVHLELDQHIMIGKDNQHSKLKQDIISFKKIADQALQNIKISLNNNSSFSISNDPTASQSQSQFSRGKIELDDLYDFNLGLLGDTLESIIAAIFLDTKSLQKTKEIYNRILDNFIIKGLTNERGLDYFIDNSRSDLIELWNKKPYAKNIKLYHRVETKDNVLYFKGYVQNTEIRRLKFNVKHKGKIRKFYKDFLEFIHKFLEDFESKTTTKEQNEISMLTQIKEFRKTYNNPLPQNSQYISQGLIIKQIGSSQSPSKVNEQIQKLEQEKYKQFQPKEEEKYTGNEMQQKHAVPKYEK